MINREMIRCTRWDLFLDSSSFNRSRDPLSEHVPNGGIEVGHRHKLKEAEKVGKKAELAKHLEDGYSRLMDPVRTANALLVGEIVDPKDTRRHCCERAKRMYGPLLKERLASRATGRICPVHLGTEESSPGLMPDSGNLAHPL